MNYGHFTQEFQTEKKHKWNLLKYILRPNDRPIPNVHTRSLKGHTVHAFPVILLSVSPLHCTSIVIWGIFAHQNCMSKPSGIQWDQRSLFIANSPLEAASAQLLQDATVWIYWDVGIRIAEPPCIRLMVVFSWETTFTDWFMLHILKWDTNCFYTNSWILFAEIRSFWSFYIVPLSRSSSAW